MAAALTLEGVSKRYGDFQAAEPTGILRMQIEPGALGIPWIANRTVLPPPPPPTR